MSTGVDRGAVTGLLVSTLLPLPLVATGLLSLHSLILSYVIETTVLLVFNALRTWKEGRHDPLLFGVVYRLVPGALTMSWFYLSSLGSWQTTLWALANAVLVLASIVTTARRTGEGVLAAAGPPEGSYMRLTVLAACIPAWLLADALARFRVLGQLGDPGSGLGGLVGRTVLDVSYLFDTSAAVVIAVWLVLWRSANEVLLELGWGAFSAASAPVAPARPVRPVP